MSPLFFSRRETKVVLPVPEAAEMMKILPFLFVCIMVFAAENYLFIITQSAISAFSDGIGMAAGFRVKCPFLAHINKVFENFYLRNK